MKKITCSYNTPCWISLECIDNQPILKIDFRIKEYKILQSGWKDCKFPDNIAINDKLYLTKDMYEKVVKVLDYYMENQTMGDSEVELTERGFSYLELTDLYGNSISIQESSSAISNKAWFGCQTKNNAFIIKNGQAYPYEYPQGQVLVSDRLHLNKADWKKMRKAMVREWNNLPNLAMHLRLISV